MSNPTPQPYRPPKQNNGLAIAALVLASVALLVGFGAFLVPMAAMLALGAAGIGDGGFSSTADDGFKGTAPQVVAGRAYAGAMLEDEVSRMERDVGGEEVRAGAVSTCHGVIDGSNWDLRVTFDDGLGHFTLDES